MNNKISPIGIANYQQLAAIEQQENNEPFVALNQHYIRWEYDSRSADMRRILPDQMLARKSVAELLQSAQSRLQIQQPNARMLVTYGYRTLEIQTNRFLEVLQEECKKFEPDPVELYQHVHEKIAVPTVAGHPTGGAVDVILIDTQGSRLDMGCAIYDYEGAYQTFHPAIAMEQLQHRLLLRECMMQEGFMPFDGEYWHFSYGDREWAFFAGQPVTLYAQKSLQEALELLQ